MSVIVFGGSGGSSGSGSGSGSSEDIYALEEKLNRLEESVSTVTDNMSGLQNSMSSLESTMSGLSNTVDTLSKTHLTLDKAYPVGSIYISYSATDPSTLFGGSWTPIRDRFLIGAGSSYSLGRTGGEEEVTLDEDQMPSHSHAFNVDGYPIVYCNGSITRRNVKQGTGTQVSNVVTATEAMGKYTWDSTSRAGGGRPHNNMPPYIAVYMWRRTA